MTSPTATEKPLVIVTDPVTQSRFRLWENAAEASGLTPCRADCTADALVTLHESPAPYAVVVDGLMRPARKDDRSEYTIPRPDPAVGRKSNVGFVNPLDFCNLGVTHDVYARGFPFSRRHLPRVYEPMPLQAGHGKPLALYSYVIGGEGLDVDAVTRLDNGKMAAQSAYFPEDDRIVGASLAPWQFAPMHGRAFAIAREFVPYYCPMFDGPLGDIYAGYVAQLVAHAAGHLVGFGGPAFTSTLDEDRPDAFTQLAAEAERYREIERLCGLLADEARTGAQSFKALPDAARYVAGLLQSRSSSSASSSASSGSTAAVRFLDWARGFGAAAI